MVSTHCTSMDHKYFILVVEKDLLKEAEPENRQLYEPAHNPGSDSSDEDFLSPTVKSTPPAERFYCRKEEEASIVRSKKYKYR